MIENNNKAKLIDLIIGFLIGLVTTALGTYLFVILIMEVDFLEGVRAVKSQGGLGKIITLGAVLNLIVFFVLLKLNKEMIARGVIFATILLAGVTVFL